MRVELKKPQSDEIVSVHADKVDDYLFNGYTKIVEPEARKSYDEQLSQTTIIDEIICTIETLPESGFSKSSGKPKVKAIEEALGKNISADQRDQAFESMSKDA